MENTVFEGRKLLPEIKISRVPPTEHPLLLMVLDRTAQEEENAGLDPPKAVSISCPVRGRVVTPETVTVVPEIEKNAAEIGELDNHVGLSGQFIRVTRLGLGTRRMYQSRSNS